MCELPKRNGIITVKISRKLCNEMNHFQGDTQKAPIHWVPHFFSKVYQQSFVISPRV